MEIRKFVRSILESIEEGLISTANSDESIKILNTGFGDKIKVVKNSESDTVLDVYLFEYDEKIIESLFSTITNLGYFVSMYSIDGFHRKFNENDFLLDLIKHKYLKPIFLKLEPNLDKKDDSLYDDVFHVTHNRFIEKIKKIGLVPKTNSKVSSHPDRVYFVKGIEGAKSLAKRFSNLEYKFPHNYVLLKIKKEAFNNIRVFSDPNLKNKGFYILGNIHPSSIDFQNSEFLSL